MTNPFFTVCTPTYNRAYILDRPYRSLLGQTCRDFEWLVIDDGSTDETERMVSAWAASADFPIRYIRQEHGHKKTALNNGVRNARGEMLLCLDSDDELTPDALETFSRYWLDIPSDQREAFVGIRALCRRPTGELCGGRFSADVIDGCWFDEFYRNGIGETLPCDRVEKLAEFPFPEDIAGFVPEGVSQSPLALRYRTRMLNNVVRIYHDDELSLTRNADPDRIGAEGSALWMATCLSDHLRWFWYNPFYFLKIGAHYTRFHLHLMRLGPRRIYFPRGFLPRLAAIATFPIGALLYLRDRLRARPVGAGVQYDRLQEGRARMTRENLKALDAHFEFGENWLDYLQKVDQVAIDEAKLGLLKLLPDEAIDGARFLDIGCGSGLHSLAALALGAAELVAIDIDPNSVEATRKLLDREAPSANATVSEMSIFAADLASLGTFDIVYSWGVLHHTGAMWDAISRAVRLVRPGGLFTIALYQKRPTCGLWRVEKRLYTASPSFVRKLIRIVYTTAYYAGLLATGRNPVRFVRNYNSSRGMNFYNDIHDWLGGYPYESASPEEVRQALESNGFELVYQHELARGFGLFGTGCAEYTFRCNRAAGG